MDPQLAEAWLARARIRAALGDVPGATQILAAAHASNAGNVQIANELAGLLVAQGQDDAAIPLLRQVLAAYPDESEVRVTLAAALLRANQLTEARIEIDKLLAVAPTDANVLMLHAFQQLLTGNIVAARKPCRNCPNAIRACNCRRNSRPCGRCSDGSCNPTLPAPNTARGE